MARSEAMEAGELKDMRFPGNTVTLDDTRSGGTGAGTPDKCFYCNGKAGHEHEAKCVCIDRSVKVRLTFDLVVARPRSWDKDDIDFQLSDSSWCMDNILGDIERHTLGDRCLCSRSSGEYLGDATIEEAIEAGLIPDSEDDSKAEPEPHGA